MSARGVAAVVLTQWCLRATVPLQAPGRSLIRLQMSEDSWAAELRQASGTVEAEETRQFLRKAQGGDEDLRVKNERLVSWLESEGAWLSELSGWNTAPHPLALATSTVDEFQGEDSGRGLLARRSIVQDQEMIRLPRRCCMTKEAAIKRGLATDATNDYVAIALLLLRERAKGKASFWAPYIDILPTTEEVAATFTWDEDDLQALDGSPCLEATSSMRSKLRNENVVDDFDDWEWAFSILFSRAIRLGTSGRDEFLALVPYVDFINHSPFSSSYVTLEPKQDSFLGQLFTTQTDDDIVVYADRSYKKFQQIYISYGPKSNSDLLLLYGFALDRNPFNSVAVRLGPSPADPLYEAKLRFAQQNGRALEGTEAFPLYADRFADEMLQFLRMICLSPADLGNNDLTDLDYSTFVSTENEIAVLDTIKAACDDALQTYDAADNRLADVPKAFLTRKQRMAARLVASENAILKKTVDAIARKTADLLAAAR